MELSHHSNVSGENAKTIPGGRKERRLPLPPAYPYPWWNKWEFASTTRHRPACCARVKLTQQKHYLNALTIRLQQLLALEVIVLTNKQNRGPLPELLLYSYSSCSPFPQPLIPVISFFFFNRNKNSWSSHSTIHLRLLLVLFSVPCCFLFSCCLVIILFCLFFLLFVS